MDINQAWKNTCKVLLGDEIGDVDRYSSYLERYVEPVVLKKSSLSGKNVYFSTDEFRSEAKYISHDELDAYLGRTANFRLEINQMKDLDSIVQAISEVAYFCGDAVLGNSKDVLESNRIFNSVGVYRSQEIYDSKYVAFSSVARYSEYLFGSSGIGETKFGIKNYSTYQNTRCLECDVIYNSSDCYFGANIMHCTDCFFCFNLRNRNHAIGNVSLSKEKYFALKESLIEQVRTELEHKKDLPGIVGLLSKVGMKRMTASDALHGKAAARKPTAPGRELDSAFADTTKLLIGKEMSPLIDYREWLYSHVSPLIFSSSPLSKRTVFAEPMKYNRFEGAEKVLIKLDEALELSESGKISDKELEKLNSTNAPEVLEKIVYISTEAEEGRNVNVMDSAAYGWAINALECWWPVKTKNAAYCGWSRQSENTFGCSLIFSSKFCLKCFNSLNLNRCFEVSNSSDCSGCYFCHNCENVHDSMFCFNIKNKRYAIGNVEVGQEQYLKIKKLVLNEIATALQAKKRFGLSIYDL